MNLKISNQKKLLLIIVGIRISTIRNFINTCLDIGIYRLNLRLRFEIRKRLDQYLPLRLVKYICKINNQPNWQLKKNKNIFKLSKEKLSHKETFTLTFLNLPKQYSPFLSQF